MKILFVVYILILSGCSNKPSVLEETIAQNNETIRLLKIMGCEIEAMDVLKGAEDNPYYSIAFDAYVNKCKERDGVK